MNNESETGSLLTTFARKKPLKSMKPAAVVSWKNDAFSMVLARGGKRKESPYLL